MLRKRSTLVLLLAASFLFSLCFRVGMPGFIPAETVHNLWLALQLQVADLLTLPLSLERWDLIATSPHYYESLVRLKFSLLTMVAGMIICGAGAVFQTTFRNPLASPNFIGVSAGVNLGNVLFIFVYTFQAITMLETRLWFCYGFAFGLSAVSLAIGALAGIKVKRFSVLDMIIVGAVISQFANVFVTYMQYRIEDIDESLVLVYQQLALGTYMLIDWESLKFFALFTLIGMVPVILLRYHYNLAALEEDEIHTMGVRPLILRVVGLGCGALLAATAIIYCGDVGMMALAIPHISRYYGADFRGCCLRSMLLGGSLLLLSRSMGSVIYIGGQALPASLIVSVIVLPFFIIAAYKQRRI